MLKITVIIYTVANQKKSRYSLIISALKVRQECAAGIHLQH
jgi:hypothetical protein